MSHAITLIKGDGIGPEVIDAAVRVVEASGVVIDWDVQLLGQEALELTSDPVPKATIDSIKTNRVALKGPTTTPIGSGYQSANVALRKALDLYGCIRPIRSIPGIEARFRDVDLVVIRENTEGLYSGQEIEVHRGCVISLRTMTDNGCNRIGRLAFEYAKNNGRQEVCLGHKANILKLGDGLLLSSMRRVRAEYPEIGYQEAIVDALAMRLVMDPQAFDVLVMENMFGDIISDLCAGLIGGLGLVPGANIGESASVFEAVHGTAPDIAGQNIANPTAMLQSAVMMLRHIGESEAASRMEGALFDALLDKSLRTRDLGGNAATSEFAGHIVEKLSTQ